MKSLFLRFKKQQKLLERRFILSKRQQFVLVTVVLTVGLILTQLVSEDYRYPMVLGLSCVAYILSAWALREDLAGIEWITLLIIPTLFTAGVSLFYFLLPVRWLTRLPVAGLYAVGMYALLLTENIYNVAASRTIALLRAAHSVGFLLTLVSFFFLVQTILAFRFSVVVQTALCILVVAPLAFQSLWAMELTDRASKKVNVITLIITAILTQMIWTLYFWPVNATLLVLLLTTFFYSLVGMAQQYMVERLYKKTITEFASVAIIVFVIILLATRWRTGV